MILNDEQQRAVDAPPKGLVISAGAGTGKTRVLTERFVSLVLEAGGDRDALDRVVAVTFTDKAAAELSQRIRAAFAERRLDSLARETDGAWVSTIHGLCSRILRRHAFQAGLDPRFSVADEVQAGVLRQEAFERAVREIGGEDEGVAALLDAYELDRIEAGVLAAHDRLRSLGERVQDVSRPRIDVGSRAGRARRTFRETAEGLRAWTTKTAVENVTLLEGWAALLDTVDPSSPDGAETVLAALAASSPAARGSAEAAALARRAQEARAELMEAATDVLLETHSAAFCSLLAAFGERYAELKHARGLLDFDDLQTLTLRLVTSHPEVAAEYRDGWVEVMVDEFQDTSRLQERVVTALAGETLTTVGDERQSIYGWRDAEVELFAERREAMGPERRTELRRNYRSHPELLLALNGLFSTDPFWPDYMTLAGSGNGAREGWPGDGPRMRYTVVEREGCEDPHRAQARAVALALAEARAGGVPQGEMAVLLHRAKHAETYEAELRAQGFDAFVVTGGTYFDKPEVQELEALLRVVANAGDDEAFGRLLVSRLAGVSDDALLLLRRHGARTLWQAATDPGRPPLATADESALSRLVSVLEDLRRDQGRKPLYDLLHEACERLDYDLALFGQGDGRGWANAMKYARLAGEFERAAPGDVGAFLDYVGLRKVHSRAERQAAMAAEGVDAVRIMSVHKAKGLEFGVVAVPELERPHYSDRPAFEIGSPDGRPALALDKPGAPPFTVAKCTPSGVVRMREWRYRREVDEAKRVFYVACTRASDALLLFGLTPGAKGPHPDSPAEWVRRAVFDDGPLADGRASLGQGEIEVRVVPPPEESPCERAAPPAARVEIPPPPETAAAASFRPRRISYTGLLTYRLCPLRYRARYALGLLPLEVATAGGALGLGDAVHRALSIAEGVTIAEDRLEAIARQCRLGAEEEKRFRGAVASFLGSALAGEVMTRGRVRREVPFGVELGGTVLEGSIDLLAIEGDEALVVDYKTGRGEADAAKLEQYGLQAACYALAVLRSGAERVRVVFVKPERGCEAHEYAFTVVDEARIEGDIRETLDAIERGEFPALEHPAPADCEGCPARGSVCPTVS